MECTGRRQVERRVRIWAPKYTEPDRSWSKNTHRITTEGAFAALAVLENRSGGITPDSIPLGYVCPLSVGKDEENVVVSSRGADEIQEDTARNRPKSVVVTPAALVLSPADEAPLGDKAGRSAPLRAAGGTSMMATEEQGAGGAAD